MENRNSYTNVNVSELPRVQELNFRHFVVSKKSGILFASARERNNGRIRNFLVDGTSVKVQLGNQFEDVTGDVSEQVRNRVSFFFHKVPVYHVSELPNF